MTFDIKTLQKHLSDNGKYDLADAITTQENMSTHTSMRVGGCADAYATPATIKDVQCLIDACKAISVPVLVVGNGSNLVVSDEGVEGLVIQLGDQFSSCEWISQNEKDQTALFSVQAGASLSKTSIRLAREGWSGLAFAAGIPGTFGGAIRMNAGAYGCEMKDVVVSVESLNMNLQMQTYKAEELGFGYRESRFSKQGGTILSVTLCLERKEPEIILKDIREMNSRRAACQPLTEPSAGSAFKRPPGHYAGALIEQAGLKGFRIGGAAVSEKHSGFIVNKGDATASDVFELVQHIIAVVQQKSGVRLEPEICFIGRGFEGTCTCY